MIIELDTYVISLCLTVFCINSINIYAGVNGLEVDQSIVVAASSAIYSYICLINASSDNSIDTQAATTSLICSLVFIAVSYALQKFNKFVLWNTFLPVYFLIYYHLSIFITIILSFFPLH